jgi:NAD(P)-dependent dehydrogenase (short-subunit alcohol dehydrogenase family)
VSGSLSGRRVVVAGASSGVGRAAALALVGEGADTFLVGRREGPLNAVRDEAGGGQVVCADIRDPADCAALARALDGVAVDALLSTAGAAPLAFLDSTSTDQWRQALETNVIGTALLLQAVVPLMTPAGSVLAVSSECVGQGRPALGAYAASKAAMEELLRTWRHERPGVRFTTVVIGGTMPTAFADGFDQAVSARAVNDWVARGLVQEQLMTTVDVANLLVRLLADTVDLPGIAIDRIELRSPSPVAGSTAHLAHQPTST